MLREGVISDFGRYGEREGGFLGTTPPVQLQFRPDGWSAWLRFNLFGRILFWRTAFELTRVPAHLSPAARHAVQQQASARLLRHLQVRLDVQGLHHVRSGPYVVVSLHEGIADALCLAQLPLPLRFVARDEIFGWPRVGTAITHLGHLAVNPESGARGYRALVQRAAKVLNGGESVLIFPQGSVLGIETAFQRGAFALARTLGAPVLPVVLSGAHRIWEHPFTPMVRYGQRVGLRVLPEIPVSELRGANLAGIRLGLQREMKRIALSGELPAPRRYAPERDGFWDGFRFDIDPDFHALHQLIEKRRAVRRASRPER